MVEELSKLDGLIYKIVGMDAKYETGSGAESESLGEKKVDWDDYNYPICLKIFHYDSDETPEPLRWRVRGLFWNHIFILFFLPWNLINNIANAAQG